MSTVTVAAKGFRRGLDQVLRAVSNDSKAGALRGVRLEADGTSLCLVATDKHRLVVSELPILAGDDAFSVVLEATSLADLPADAPDAEVVLTVDAHHASVSVGGHSIDVALLDGDFPDHRALLGQITGDARGTRLIVDRVAVIDAIEELPDDEPLRVQLKPNALEFGQLVPIAVDATYEGRLVSLFVEPAYLHDAVGAATGPLLALEVVDETSPIVVRTPGDKSYLAVVMPLLVGSARSRRR